MVWKYVSPVASLVATAPGPVAQGQIPTGSGVFTAYRYPADYPGLAGHDLTPGDPIELPPLTPKPSPTATETPTETPTNTPSPTPTQTPTRTPTSTPAVPCGDVNGDMRVSSVDAQFILQYDAGLIQTLLPLAHGDVNGDGNVNSVDASLILQREAGLISRLTC
jgi:hypothetical protein